MNRQALLKALQSCGRDPSQVRHLRENLPGQELLRDDRFLASYFIEAYGRCCCLDSALQVFNAMEKRNTHSWAAIITAYAQNGHLQDALFMYQRMPVWHPKPCVAVIRALGQKSRLNEARSLLDSMPHQDYLGWNMMIAAYTQKGHMEEACNLFEKMEGRDVVTWTSLIRGFAHIGSPKEAETVFRKMPATNDISWNTLIGMFAENGDVLQSKLLFDQMPEPTAVSRTTMLKVYAQNGHMKEAEHLFQSMPERDTVSWTTMLQAYAGQGDLLQAKLTFDQMPFRDEISWTTMLAAFSQSGSAEESRALFDKMPRWDLVSGNAMVAAYAHNGHVENAMLLFQSLQQHDLVSWTSLIAGYAHNGYCEFAIQLFEQMVLEGVEPDSIIFLSILTACSHVGLVKDGLHFFQSMVGDHGIRPIVEHYCCMIDILGRIGKLRDAEELTRTMPYVPNELVYGSLLAACRHQQDVDRGRRVAGQAIEASPDSYTPYVLLANLHSKSGRLEESAEVRKFMSEQKMQKQPGISSVRIEGKVYRFVAGDTAFPHKLEVLMTLEKINSLLREGGYVPETSEVMHDVAEAEKEKLLSHHSEKLALALGVVRTSPGTPVVIVKNLRVCFDCHTVMKLVSKILQRQISLRDASRFHHFRDGKCSCQDYW